MMIDGDYNDEYNNGDFNDDYNDDYNNDYDDDDDAARGGRGRAAKLVGRPLVIGTRVHPLTYKPPPPPSQLTCVQEKSLRG